MTIGPGRRARYSSLILLACLLGCDDGDSPAPPSPSDAAVDGAPHDTSTDRPADATAQSPPPDAGLPDRGVDAPGDASETGDGDTSETVRTDSPAAPAKLDLIFLVDNSSSMAEEQAALIQNFPALITALSQAPGGLPDLHIGILSSNVGAGPNMPAAECPPGGDRGKFQVNQACGVDVSGGNFLRVDAAGKGNFTGALPQTFSCLAALGTRGCGYEHHLLSLYFALDGVTNLENRGFLRDDAALGIVILADEDDCSGAPSASFFDDRVMGQSGSLRCSLLGHVCGGRPVPAATFTAPLATCAPYVRGGPNENESRLIDVDTFVSMIKGFKKGRADKMLVSTIIGWSDDPAARYTIIQRTGANAIPQLDTGPICQSASGTATPAIRLHSFATGFPNHTVHSICTQLDQAMADIGKKLTMLSATP